MSKESSTDSLSSDIDTENKSRKKREYRSRWYVNARDRLGDISWKISSLIDPKERMQMVMDLLLGNPARQIRQSQMFGFAAA